jgi:MYXO-CTERM domain-containing protein
MKPRWWILFWTAICLAIPGVAWAAPAASFTLSRTTGAAPLAVFVDASGSTCAGCMDVSNPWHDLSYKWNFGDPNAGTWAMSGRSKTADVGPSAAHVFEQPGMYTITLTVIQPSGASATVTKTVEVTDPDVAYAGANTYCYRASAGGSFTGCPAGAQQKTNASFNAAISECKGPGHRCLFRSGDTFTAGQQVALDATAPGTIGAFGAGNKPILDASALGANRLFFGGSGGQDYRVMDLFVKGPGALFSRVYGASHPQKNTLFLRVEAAPDTWHTFAEMEYSTLQVKDWHRYIFIVDCKATKIGMTGPGQTGGGNVLYIAYKDSAILGNDFQDTRSSADSPLTGEHIIRAGAYENVLIAHNRLGGAAGGKHVITLRSFDGNIGCDGMICYPSKRGMIQANTLYARQDWAVQVCGKAGTQKNGCEDTLVDGNYATVNNAYPVNGASNAVFNLADGDTTSTRTTFRNNICNLTGLGSNCASIYLTSLARAFNNTCFRGDAGSVDCVHGVGSPPAGTSTRAQNNLVYSTGSQVVASGAWGTKGNNVMVSMNPFVAAAPGTGPDSFKLKQGASAIDGGAAVPNQLDFGGRLRNVGGSPDVGAWEYGAVDSDSPVQVTLTASVNPAAVEMPFTLSATKSGGSGTPDFKWDCDGSGTFEMDTNATAMVSCPALPAGIYNVGVQVTDSSGSDTDNLSLEVKGTCGNGVREGSELCDKTDLNEQTCLLFGFDGGTLACSADCAAFDTNGCTGDGGVCGDGACSGLESPDTCFEDCGVIGEIYAYDSTVDPEVLLYEDWAGQAIDYAAMASRSLGVLADCKAPCSAVAFVLDNNYADPRTTRQNTEPFSMGGDDGKWYFGIGCPDGAPCSNPLELGGHHITFFPCSGDMDPPPWASEAEMRAACKGVMGPPKDLGFEIVDGYPPDAGPGSGGGSSSGGAPGGAGGEGGCGCRAAPSTTTMGWAALAGLLALASARRRRR